MSAWTVPRTWRRVRARISAGFGRSERPARVRLGPGQLVVDGGVEEHGEDRRGRSVDGHRHRGGRVAEVEAPVQLLHVVEGGDRHPRVPDLAVDVGADLGVEPVEGDRVEGGRQPGGRLALGQQVEAPVGAEGVPLAGEHPGRILPLALEGEHARGVGELPGQVLRSQPPQQLAVVGEPGQGHPGDRRAGERHPGVLLVAVLGGPSPARRPAAPALAGGQLAALGARAAATSSTSAAAPRRPSAARSLATSPSCWRRRAAAACSSVLR